MIILRCCAAKYRPFKRDSHSEKIIASSAFEALFLLIASLQYTYALFWEAYKARGFSAVSGMKVYDCIRMLNHVLQIQTDGAFNLAVWLHA